MVVEDGKGGDGDYGEEDGESFEPEIARGGNRGQGAVGASGQEGAGIGCGGGDEGARMREGAAGEKEGCGEASMPRSGRHPASSREYVIMMK